MRRELTTDSYTAPESRKEASSVIAEHPHLKSKHPLCQCFSLHGAVISVIAVEVLISISVKVLT